MDNLTLLRFYGERQYSSIFHHGEARTTTWRIGATTVHKGQVAVVVESGGERAAIAGDLVHHHQVQFIEPCRAATSSRTMSETTASSWSLRRTAPSRPDGPFNANSSKGTG
ncbi:hypothetical protein ABZY57_16525 [Streptomyces sp. NPDC006450]|uniref:hypothetical protein n=1 Tax=Streptomyces sp. NPDC006450 TaxID=3155458 RepID=UPI0033B2FA16